MSTKLITFKVPKQSVFTFSDSIREHVLKNWSPVFDTGVAKVKLADFIQDNDEQFEKELQFFEVTRFKDVYLVRVLESGYGVHNYLWGLHHPTCNYNDQTDIPRSERGNKAIADEVDALIAKRHYFIVPAVSVGDYLHIIWRTPAQTELDRWLGSEVLVDGKEHGVVTKYNENSRSFEVTFDHDVFKPASKVPFRVALFNVEQLRLVDKENEKESPQT